MLVIRRRAGQSVLIGDEIEIEIVETAPNRVTLGISAPREISVLRGEIRLTREANEAASRTAAPGAFRGLLERFQNR